MVQGITELTPLYAKVEGLQGAPNSVVWDMRIATSSIPPDMLDRILDKARAPRRSAGPVAGGAVLPAGPSVIMTPAASCSGLSKSIPKCRSSKPNIGSSGKWVRGA